MGVLRSPIGRLGPSLSQLERPIGLYGGTQVSDWETWLLTLTTREADWALRGCSGL